jgi:transcriptional regulator with XRE-family HTH domain
LAAWAADLLAKAMDEQGLSKSDLAARLGRSRAFVTQVLSGRRNMTLRTLADLAWACGNRVIVSAEPLREGQFVSHPVCIIRKERPRVIARFSDLNVDRRYIRNLQHLVA